MNRLIVGMVALATAFESIGNTGVDGVEVTDGDWTAYVPGDYGESREVKLLPASTPVENYRKNLEIISPEFVNSMCERDFSKVFVRQGAEAVNPFESRFLTVTRIGKWHDFVVYDLANRDVLHRSLV